MKNNVYENKNNLFKWIGGKKWLSNVLKEQVLSNFKNEDGGIETYIEPFIGGMGSFMALLPVLQEKGIKRFILNDINKSVIATYDVVKREPEKLLKGLSILEAEYFKLIPNDSYKYHKTRDKVILKELLKDGYEYFTLQKKRFNRLKSRENLNNEELIDLASIFLFLTHHSFNGIYRENSKGEYNTSFNWDNLIIDMERKRETVLRYSKLFNSVDIIFENLDVFELLEKYSLYKSSFIYLDPPYMSNNSSGENKYNKDHFGTIEQRRLLDRLREFNNFLYSNHYLSLFVEYFTQDKHSYIKINRKNTICGKGENRGNDVEEILGLKIS